MADGKKKDLIYDLLTSGTMDTLDRVERSRLIFTNAVTFAGTPILYFFSINAFLKGHIAIALSTFITGTLLITQAFLTRRIKSFRFFRTSTAVVLFILFFYLGFTGGTESSGILFVLAYPLMALFLLGARWGTVAAILLWAAMGFSLLHPDLNLSGFSTQYTLRFLGSYLTIYMFSISYQVTMENSQKALKVAWDDLSAEKEQTDYIMHHVEQGLFLLDENFAIAGSYSRSLNDLLMDQQNLEGRVFPDILRPQMGDQDYNAATDYLDMLFRDNVNPELLKEINPLEEVTFRDEGGAHEKILRFIFSRISRQDGSQGLLVSASDITEEIKLQAQLLQDEQNYARNMEQLFQIIHISPSVLKDFLQDSRGEMDNINRILKAGDKNASRLLDQIYKILHNIKGNAALLGLKSLVEQIHGTESQIQEVRRSQVKWDDLLDITISLGSLNEVLSEIEELVGRIENFQLDSLATSSSEDALHKLVESEAREQGKEARLEIEGFRLDELEKELRQNVRDVAVQLIRNSLAHGIEEPEVRKNRGKDGKGLLSLWGEKTSTGFSLIYRDDGAGLDPEKIREKLKNMENSPVKNPDSLSRVELIRFIFSTGFSTRDEADMSAGRGVGMSLIKDKVNQAGGKIKLGSKAGQYTEFRFDFPVAEAG